jgi:hypothetical protein
VLTLEFVPGRGGTVDTVRIGGGEGQQRQEEQSEETDHTFESVAARRLFSNPTVRTVLCRELGMEKERRFALFRVPVVTRVCGEI